ncbi:MAG: hypothetical protein IJP62_03550 [Treponema sp.]|nr:hypothetical protein [Treponema sp.]
MHTAKARFYPVFTAFSGENAGFLRRKSGKGALGMDAGKGFEDFMERREALEAEIGEVRNTEEECPGVWYVCTGGDGERNGTEFYVVDRDADAIPNEAKAYGGEIPDCPGYLLYPMDAQRQTRKIIQYEIMRYRMRESASDADRETLRETALDGMEERPEYFGTFPPPTLTPYGHTARYKVLMNGVFWIQTDAPATALAVAYPIWGVFPKSME